MASHCPYEVLIALDLESTCDENHANPSDIKVPRDQGEIIELSFAVISVAHLRVVHQQQIFVRPEHTPLTPFCTNLTGITQETIDENGVSLAEALGILDGFIKSNVGDQAFCFVCHGEWDLRYQLSRESRDKNISLPGYFSVFFDAIQETNLWLSLAERAGPRKVQANKHSLVGLCTALGIHHQGRLHSGIDDALTISKIVLTIMENAETYERQQQEVAPGQPVVVPTRWPFETPVNLAEQLAEFHETRSTVIHLGGLPYKATINEVDAWVGQAGIKAAELWMVRNSDGRPDGTGFAVYHSHEDAKACLALNGRILGDRTIQVAPATANDLEQSAMSRTSFPTPEELAQQQPEMKPGDWLCSSCQYHNFASRRNCFKCHTVSPGAGGANGSAGRANGMNGGYSGQQGSVALRPGDWVCPYPSCRFQNFASRLECMRCRTRRSPNSSVGGPPLMGPNFGGMPSAPASKVLLGDWQCPTCQVHNFAARTRCIQCGSGAPPERVPYAQQPTGGMPRSRATDRPGDWNCPNESCRYHNYASRMECYRCGTKKGPENENAAAAAAAAAGAAYPYGYPAPGYGAAASYGATAYGSATGGYGAGPYGHVGGYAAAAAAYGAGYGAQAASTPGATMKPGDWICPNDACRYHNFAKRETCMVCGTSSSAAIGSNAAAAAAGGYGSAYGGYGFGGANSNGLPTGQGSDAAAAAAAAAYYGGQSAAGYYDWSQAGHASAAGSQYAAYAAQNGGAANGHGNSTGFGY